MIRSEDSFSGRHRPTPFPTSVNVAIVIGCVSALAFGSAAITIGVVVLALVVKVLARKLAARRKAAANGSGPSEHRALVIAESADTLLVTRRPVLALLPRVVVPVALAGLCVVVSVLGDRAMPRDPKPVFSVGPAPSADAGGLSLVGPNRKTVLLRELVLARLSAGEIASETLDGGRCSSIEEGAHGTAFLQNVFVSPTGDAESEGFLQPAGFHGVRANAKQRDRPNAFLVEERRCAGADGGNCSSVVFALRKASAMPALLRLMSTDGGVGSGKATASSGDE